jgi:hypothetical protein
MLNIDSASVRPYADSLLGHNFIPTITLPTRITENSATLIDHINVYRPVNQMKSNILSGNLFFYIADHLPNFMLINCQSAQSQKRDRPYIRIFSERNILKFKTLLSNASWEEVLTSHDVNESYNKFTDLFSQAYDECFPLVKQSRLNSKKKNWITPAIMVSIKHKNRLYKKFLTKPSPLRKAAYKKYKNKLLEVIQKAKVTYYTSKLNKDKAKVQDVWKIYSELLGRVKSPTRTNVSKLIHEGQTISNDSQIAKTFNEYFATIGEKLAAKCLPTNTREPHQPYLNDFHTNTLFLSPVTEEEISKIVLKLDANKAPGLDGFHVRSIKNALPYIKQPLTYIYNLSFMQACVPKKT